MHTAVEKSVHNFFLKKNGAVVSTSVDDRLRWIPLFTVFLLDKFGLQTRSSWKKQVLIAGAAEATRYLAADTLKKFTSEKRPFPYTGHNSFPSGHACSVFAGEEFMHKELKNSLPLLQETGIG